ncbi:MAG: leucine-rich repeat protein [Alistipes sp.]|nr:leucine-rich repeat protein [Alistipes sp.]
MKKLLLLFAVMAMVLPGCKKINEELDVLGARLDKLEQETIPTIDEQIAAINVSLDALDAMDGELKGYIDGLTATATNLQEQINATNTKIDEVKSALQNEISTAKAEVLAELEALETELKNELSQINTTIETLKTKDEELDQKIADLRTYVDTELGKTTDWVNATFATLEQYGKLTEDVAAVQALVENYKNEATQALNTAIANLETSLKAWVGEKLADYAKIADVNAEIAKLEKAITNGDSALQKQLDELKSQLETTKQEVTKAYQKAIKEAIETNNGVINAKIAEEIGKVNGLIEELNSKLAQLQIQVDKNTEDIAKLLARIQSVSYIPTYEDGKATVQYLNKISQVTLDFEITPKDAVAELAKVWEDAVSLKAVYTQTRAVSFVDMPIVAFEADAENGVITVTASGENLSAEFFNGDQTASVRLAISDGNNSVTSEYTSMIAAAVTGISEFVVPINEIWYTSTGGAVVEPYATDVFGANIVSNTYKNGQGIITFDAPVTSIGEAAFQKCVDLTSIMIPYSVMSIGIHAFFECSDLESFHGKYASLDKRCLVIEGRLLSFAPAGLEDYTLPDGITVIGKTSFEHCESLESITISNEVTSIEQYAFYKCYNLTSATFGNSVTSIANDSFKHCTSLKSVMIGNGIASIGDDAFKHCINLTSVYCKALTPPSLGLNTFFDNDSNRKIYVPKNSVEAYKTADGWSDFADQIIGE